MNSKWKVGAGLLGIVVGVIIVLMLQPMPSARANLQKAADGGPHYTVVATDGTHLVVTDNKTNKVHFYAIEQDGKPGDELKFRGSINLEDVGKPTIQPTKAK